MKSASYAKSVAKILIKIKAVSFRFDPPFTYTSGLKSPIYLDNRIIISHPQKRKQIVNIYADIIKNNIGLNNVDYLSATATAAIPIGAMLAAKLNLPLIYVRAENKKHGKENKIEGYLVKDSQVVIIEDHISTAGSAVDNAQAVRQAGGIAKYVISTTTYETAQAEKNIADAKLELFTLVTGKQILNMAQKYKLINSKEAKLVQIWFTDPVNWYSKYY